LATADIPTTTVEPGTDHYNRYLAYMREYENDLADLEAKARQIPTKDFITSEDEERVIRDHFKEEELLEKSIGKKFLTKIEHSYRTPQAEESSDQADDDSKNMEESIMNDFMKKVKQ